MPDLDNLRASLMMAEKLSVSLAKQKADAEGELASLVKEIEAHEQALALCDACLVRQTALKSHMEAGMTDFISACYDESFEFKFDTIYRADKTTLAGARVVVYKDGKPGAVSLGDGAYGDAMFDIVNIGTVVYSAALIENFTPFVLIDEGTSHVSDHKLPIFGDLLVELNKIRPIQYVIISHADIAFPSEIRVTMPGTVSLVENVK